MADFDFSKLMNDPMLQFSLGLLKAGGPSKTPHSFGQDLASAAGDMQQSQMGDFKNQYLQAQIQQMKDESSRDAAYQAMLGGSGQPAQAQAAQGMLAPDANGITWNGPRSDGTTPESGLLAPQAPAAGGVLAPQQAGGMAGIMNDPRIKQIVPLLQQMKSGEGMKMMAGQLVPKEAPSGYVYTPDGNMKAVTGGPADTKVQAAKDKDIGVLTSLTADLDRLASQANEILSAPGLDDNYGMMGMIPNRPGSKASDAQALVDTLKSQTAFNVLQNMRNNSKTGGALGAVSNYEQQMLQDNLAALGKAQSAPQVKSQLQKIIQYANDAKNRANSAFSQRYGDGQQPASGGMLAPQAPPAGPLSGQPGAAGAQTAGPAPKRAITMDQVTSAAQKLGKTPQQVIEEARQKGFFLTQ